MARLVLAITADLSGVKAALGELPGIARSASASISAEARTVAQAQVKASQDAAKETARNAREAAREVAKAEREKAAAARATAAEDKRLTAEMKRDRAKAAAEEKKATDDLAKAKQKADAAVVASAKKAADDKLKIDQDFARESESITVRLQNARAKAEEAATAAASREAGRRVRIAQQAAMAVAHAAVSFAGAAHSEISGARGGAASSQRTLGRALYQGGADMGEVQQRMGEMRRFADAHGLDVGELSEAALAAQRDFSVFGTRHMAGAAHRGERDALFRRFLHSAEIGNETGNAVGSAVTLGGLFTGIGLDDVAADRMQRFAAGAAQAGAVSEEQITGTGRQPIRRRISQAIIAASREPGFAQLSQADQTARRTQAAQDAFTQTYAEMQVLQSAGFGPRLSGNAIANANAKLTGRVSQDAVLHNIMHTPGVPTAMRAQLRAALFEADPNQHGHMRLRAGLDGTVVGLTAAAMGVQGVDATMLGNVFAGGGHANRQALLQPVRNIMGALAGQDVNGVSLLQSVRDIANVRSTSLSDEDINRGKGIFESDPQAVLNREQNAREAALTDNTSALVRMSHAFDGWASRNPLSATGLKTGVDLALGGAGVQVAAKLLGRSAPTAVEAVEQGGFRAILRGGGRAISAVGSRIAGAAGILSDLLHPSNESMTGRTEFFDDAAAIRAHRAAGGGAAGVAAGTTALTASGQSTHDALVAAQTAALDRLNATLTSGNVRATVTPLDAAHATAGAVSANQRNAPPGHP